MDLRKLILKLIQKSQKDGKIFETRKIEFKQNYELRNSNGKIIKAVQAEMIKDVMSLANSLPDPELDMGLLILGVSTDGNIIDNYSLQIEDVAELSHLINGVLERPITFSYREYSIKNKKIGVIIVPKSSGMPHIIKNNLSENDKIYLKTGECWTRTEGGKKLAMASDFDDMYEYSSGINKFQSVKSRKKLEISVKHKKTRAQANKVEEILSLDNDDFNERIKRLLNR